MRNMPFYTKIKKGILSWKNKKVFDAYCLMMKDGDYTLTLSKTIASKTNEQLGYFHAVVVPTAFQQMVRDGNKSVMIQVNDKFKEIPLTEDYVVDMFKKIWADSKGCEVKSKADMSIEEASELIEMSILWSARYLGCVIPEPEK